MAMSTVMGRVVILGTITEARSQGAIMRLKFHGGGFCQSGLEGSCARREFACAKVRAFCEGSLGSYVIGRVQRFPCRKKPLSQLMDGFVLRYRILDLERGPSEICARCLSLLLDILEVETGVMELLPAADVVPEDLQAGVVAVYETYDVGPPVVCAECGRPVLSTYGEARSRADLN